MRKTILICALLIAGCTSQHTAPEVQQGKKEIVKETVYVPSLMDCDSIEAELQLYKEGYKKIADSLKAQNAKIYRVKFYLTLCQKNPKQDKFLKGWVRRAIE